MDFFSNQQPRGSIERSTSSIQPKRFAVAILVGLLAMLTGCAPAWAERQPFNKSATPIKSIGLLEVLQPQTKRLGASGFTFVSIIRSANTEGVKDAGNEKFTVKMTEQKLDVGAKITLMLEAELKKRGYDVTILSDQRPAIRDTGDDPDYSMIKTDAQAILHVSLGFVGYRGLNEWVLNPATPTIYGEARLISTKDMSQIYYQAFAYGGPTFEGENVDYFPAPSHYHFDGVAAVMAYPKLAPNQAIV